MKKVSIFAFCAICFISIFAFTGCDLLKDHSTSGGVQYTKMVSITTDGKLTAGDDDTHFNLTLNAGEQYTVNCSVLSEYASQGYYIEFEILDKDYADILEVELTTGIVKAKNVDRNKYASFTIKLKQNGVQKRTFYVFVSVKTSSNGGNLQNDVQVTFNKGDMLYNKHSYNPWFFNVAVGETFRIRPVVTGITNYSLEYGVRDAGDADYLTVANSGDVTPLQTKTSSISVYIKVLNSSNSVVNTSYINCFIDGTDLGTDPDYKDALIKLTANSDDVAVKENSQTSYYAYELTAGFEDVEYLRPNISITGYTGSVTFSIEGKNNYINFVSHDGENYFYTNKDSKYLNGFYITAKKAGTDIILDRILCTVALNHIGSGSYSIIDEINNTTYKENQTINVLQYKNLRFRPMFSGQALINYTSGALVVDEQFNYQVTQGNSVIASVVPTVYRPYIKVYADKIGESKIALNYTSTDSAGDSHNYSIILTINVEPVELESIYVPNPEYITIDGSNNVSLNGKLIASYNDGTTQCVNGYGYSCEVTNVSESIKKVTISYSGKSVEYNVNTANTSTYNKTTLSQNYSDYMNNVYPGCCPSSGDVKVLVLPVWFTNSSDYISETLTDNNGKNQKQQVIADLNEMLFANKANSGWCSLREFYLDESFGELDITGTVSNWINIDHSSTYYSWGTEGSKDLVEEAVEAYFTINTSDSPANYDSDGDKKVDAVMVYYGAPFVGSPSTIAEYKQFGRGFVSRSSVGYTILSTEYRYSYYSFINFADMYNVNAPSTTTNLSGYAALNNYAIEQLQTYADLSSHYDYFSAETSIHEFGHILGLYDLYDTVLDSQVFPAGQRTMQDSDTSSHDPYSMMALGWVKPYMFDASSTSSGNYSITIKDFASSGDLILLTPQWNNSDTPFDEYILIELYTPTGLNAQEAKEYKAFNNTEITMSNAGVRIWHVNATLEGNCHKYNNDSSSSADEDNNTYHLVHYIRNVENCAYGKDAPRISDSTMFHTGDTFSINEFDSQFKGNASLDDGSLLNWSVTIGEITTDENGNASVTINLVRA